VRKLGNVYEILIAKPGRTRSLGTSIHVRRSEYDIKMDRTETGYVSIWHRIGHDCWLL
jgi:hypothetical protein